MLEVALRRATNRVLSTLGVTAGLPSSAGSRVGQAGRASRGFNLGRPRVSFLVVGIIAALAAGPSHGAEVAIAKPPAPAEQIAHAVHQEIDAGLFPGAVVLVGRPGEVLYHEAFGHAQVVPDEVEMPRDSIFGLASVTKVVATGTAFGVCVDEGWLDFEMPIRDALPELDGDGIDAVTVRHLATHTSGFANTKYHGRVQGEGMLELMLGASPQWAAGSRYHYCCFRSAEARPDRGRPGPRGRESRGQRGPFQHGSRPGPLLRDDARRRKARQHGRPLPAHASEDDSQPARPPAARSRVLLGNGLAVVASAQEVAPERLRSQRPHGPVPLDRSGEAGLRDCAHESQPSEDGRRRSKARAVSGTGTDRRGRAGSDRLLKGAAAIPPFPKSN